MVIHGKYIYIWGFHSHGGIFMEDMGEENNGSWWLIVMNNAMDGFHKSIEILGNIWGNIGTYTKHPLSMVPMECGNSRQKNMVSFRGCLVWTGDGIIGTYITPSFIFSGTMWGFPKSWGVPNNGWFSSWKMPVDENWGYPYDSGNFQVAPNCSPFRRDYKGKMSTHSSVLPNPWIGQFDQKTRMI